MELLKRGNSREAANVIMDFPTAWAFCRATSMEDHEAGCSYRVANGGFLCDCKILNDEYERLSREAGRGNG